MTAESIDKNISYTSCLMQRSLKNPRFLKPLKKYCFYYVMTSLILEFNLLGFAWNS